MESCKIMQVELNSEAIWSKSDQNLKSVTLSSSTMLDVLINPPYLMLELSEEEVKYNDFRRCHYNYTRKKIYWV